MTLRVLDCDHVFETLTRGPFSGRERDDALVEAHLQACSDCRQLAEALRPAVDLIHESLQEEGLPSYEGGLPPVDENAAEAVMTKVRRAKPTTTVTLARPVPPSARRIDPVSIMIAGVVGLILGVWITYPGERFEKPRLNLQAATAPDSQGLALLENLHLMQVCLAEEPASIRLEPLPTPVHQAEVADYACCTRCHNVQQSDHGALFKHRQSITKLLQGCQACHKA